MKLKRGQYVRHSKYGWGSILECNRDQTMVYFRTVGVRKFVTSGVIFALVPGEASKKKAVT
jgi:hypothetical protein